MIHIAIVEDSIDAREGFRYLLNLDPDIKVIQAFESAEPLLMQEELLNNIDVILMDIELPGMDGIEATHRIRRAYPDIDILILTIFEEQDKILRAIHAGATGYVLKNSDPTELVSQIKSIREGGSPISPHVARKLLEQMQKSNDQQRTPEDYQLTKREIEICIEIINGYTYREMAEHLNMAGSTAKRHILNVYKKLGVNSKVEFMKKVVDEGLFHIH